MRLLYITNGIKGSGGLERVLSIKASYLADHLGYEVHIAILNNRNAPFFYTFSDKIIVHDIIVGGNPLQYIASYSRGMRQLVDQVKPDVISVCDDGLKGFFLPSILRKPCPMIYERHVSKLIALGPDPSARKRIWYNIQNKLMHRLGRRFDRFVLLTDDNRAEWDLPNVEVIPNPVSFFPDGVSALDSKTVIAVGKQSYQKGFDLLLRSWQEIAASFPDWKLHIYGKFDPAQRLEELSNELGVASSVSFFQPFPHIQEKFLEASIFAFSSRFEGFGMVLIEAMACGVPCVSYDCPCGPSEIVSDGVDGFLVRNGDVHAFAGKLSTLMRDDKMRTDFGAMARKKAARYLPEQIATQWDQLFKALTS